MVASARIEQNIGFPLVRAVRELGAGGGKPDGIVKPGFLVTIPRCPGFFNFWR
jgi:hypothetical protein